MSNEQINLYSVTDWQSYYLVEAASPRDALGRVYGIKHYTLIDNATLTEETVVHMMCCEYRWYAETILESLNHDIDRVLWLDANPDTLRYQISF